MNKVTTKTTVGIRVDIVIECETEEEILTHLSVIRGQIRKKLKTVGEVNKPILLEDSNCYGSHNIIISLQ